jgi:hypothetical protein
MDGLRVVASLHGKFPPVCFIIDMRLIDVNDLHLIFRHFSQIYYRISNNADR